MRRTSWELPGGVEEEMSARPRGETPLSVRWVVFVRVSVILKRTKDCKQQQTLKEDS